MEGVADGFEREFRKRRGSRVLKHLLFFCNSWDSFLFITSRAKHIHIFGIFLRFYGQQLLEVHQENANEIPQDVQSQANHVRLVFSTHGISRPFLPSMIQKNSEAEVQQHTAHASTLLSNLKDSSNRYKAVGAALDEVCKLKGVGPATGTLVLSIYDPRHVPFFADEVFAWVVDRGGNEGWSDQRFEVKNLKLKYDRKEYAALWEGVSKVVKGVGEVTAQEIEKTAYVLMYADVLSEDERVELESLVMGKTKVERPDQVAVEADGTAETKRLGKNGHEADGSTAEEIDPKGPKEVTSGKSVSRQSQGRKRKAQTTDNLEPGPGLRRSKRAKMRKNFKSLYNAGKHAFD